MSEKTMTVSEDQTGVMISKVDLAIEYAISRYGSPDDLIESFREDYMEIVVTGPDDDDGYESAKTALDRVKRMRIDTENIRKEVKKDALRYGKAVDGEANRIKALLEPIETHLKTQADIVRLEKARLKIEKENEQKAIVAERVKLLNELGASVDLPSLETMDQDDFQITLMSAKVEFEIRSAEHEKEQAKQDADRQELEALRAEKREAASKAEQKQISERNEEMAPVRESLHSFAVHVSGSPIPDSIPEEYVQKIRSILGTAGRAIQDLGR